MAHIHGSDGTSVQLPEFVAKAADFVREPGVLEAIIAFLRTLADQLTDDGVTKSATNEVLVKSITASLRATPHHVKISDDGLTLTLTRADGLPIGPSD